MREREDSPGAPAGSGRGSLCLRVRVAGLVQGVWFRASTRDEALRRGLSGWVRNLPDGGVEALFEGTEDALRGMLAWCRHGPRGARVDRVAESWGPATGTPPGFAILR